MMETKTWAHQDQALKAIASTKEKSHVIEIPCGCGKTLIMEKQINAEIPTKKNSYNVILTPTLLLIKQTIKAFQQNNYNWISIFCNKQVTKDYGFNTTNPNHIVKHLDLKIQEEIDFDEIEIYENLETEVDVETENMEDRCIMESNPKMPKNHKLDPNKQTIIICSYASINVIKSLIENTNFKVNTLVCDEGHHTISDTIQWIYESEKINKITHYTATRLAKMTNEVQGPTIFNYNIRDAIKNGVIHDYEIAVMLYKTDVYYGNQNHPERNKVISIEIDKLLTKKKNKHVLCFNAFSSSHKKTSTNTKDFTNIYKEVVSDANIFSVNSEVKAKERSKIIEDFTKDPEHKYNILFNCKMMGEGINIPKVDTVIIIESTESKCLTTQRLGRALRKNGTDTKFPLFVICVDVTENDKNLIDLRRFEDVINCLSDLAASDTQICKFINGEAVEIVKFYNEEYLTNTSIKDIKTFLKDLRDKCVKKHKITIDDRFDDYIKFYNTHGRIPREDNAIDSDESSLAYWVSRIRKNPNKLSQDQIDTLSGIPKFYWNLNDRWTTKFLQLQSYVNTYGKFPPSTELKDGKSVTTESQIFIMTCRRSKLTYSKERIKLLESINGWKWSVVNTYYDKYYELLRFYVRYGKEPVRVSSSDEEKKLCIWKDKLEKKTKVTRINQSEIKNRIFCTNIYYKLLSCKSPKDYPDIIKELEQYAQNNNMPFLNVLDEDDDEKPETKTSEIPNPNSKIKIKKGLPPVFGDIKNTSKGNNRTKEQAKFRIDCLNRFNNTCVLSGIKCVQVLDAAHIIPAEYKTYQNVNTENALLLEKTLHYAFDNFLFSINPKKMEIRISKTMQEDEVLYKRLESLTVNCEFTDLEKDHLQWHYERFKIIDSIKLKNKESEVDKKQE